MRLKFRVTSDQLQKKANPSDVFFKSTMFDVNSGYRKNRGGLCWHASVLAQKNFLHDIKNE